MTALLKKICLKDVCYFILQAWQDELKQAVQNSFKHLFSSIEEIELSVPPNYFDDEDDIPITRLYKSLFEDNNLPEIMEWANGQHEQNISFGAENIIDDLNNVEDENDIEENENTNINHIIESFNSTIEWAEGNNFSLNEILLLRRMREKAVLKKFYC